MFSQNAQWTYEPNLGSWWYYSDDEHQMVYQDGRRVPCIQAPRTPMHQWQTTPRMDPRAGPFISGRQTESSSAIHQYPQTDYHPSYMSNSHSRAQLSSSSAPAKYPAFAVPTSTTAFRNMQGPQNISSEVLNLDDPTFRQRGSTWFKKHRASFLPKCTN